MQQAKPISPSSPNVTGTRCVPLNHRGLGEQKPKAKRGLNCITSSRNPERGRRCASTFMADNAFLWDVVGERAGYRLGRIKKGFSSRRSQRRGRNEVEIAERLVSPFAARPKDCENRVSCKRAHEKLRKGKKKKQSGKGKKETITKHRRRVKPSSVMNPDRDRYFPGILVDPR